MILTFENGRLVGSQAAAYPAEPEALARVSAAGQRVVDVPPFEPAYWHLADGELRIRPRMALSTNVTLGSDGYQLVIDGVPAGAAVEVTGPVGGGLIADGEETVLLFGEPGSYDVAVVLDPYQPERLYINVMEAA